MRHDRLHLERHRFGSTTWLRAAVLGANDGIVSTASLLLGVAAASAAPDVILTTGVAGLVAGAMSMAAGEYVSVSSQADSEQADLERERAELRADPVLEQDELAAIYVRRGLEPEVARTVAAQLMAHDALGAHALEELGISDLTAARPLQASLASAASFAAGAVLPLLCALLAPAAAAMPAIAAGSLGALALLGAAAARIGGAPVGRAIWRVSAWGALAMAVTAAIGALVGAAV
ncbi:MAG: VIT1/CCC1 transporter family protein [Proteobacteria bacterium]|jgi:VIT1/CCC1 family predicted Fe2+/Mn2+ transporter|nr:VIT1/CCC1 transporter family protein [Pseudomonadota bacterium]